MSNIPWWFMGLAVIGAMCVLGTLLTIVYILIRFSAFKRLYQQANTYWIIRQRMKDPRG